MEQQPKDFSQGTKFTAIFGVVIVIGAIYFGAQVLGDTTFNLTLTANPALRDGLNGHWTLDGVDIDESQASAEVRDRSGNGFHGNMVNFD